MHITYGLSKLMEKLLLHVIFLEDSHLRLQKGNLCLFSWQCYPKPLLWREESDTTHKTVLNNRFHMAQSFTGSVIWYIKPQHSVNVCTIIIALTNLLCGLHFEQSLWFLLEAWDNWRSVVNNNSDLPTQAALNLYEWWRGIKWSCRCIFN